MYPGRGHVPLYRTLVVEMFLCIVTEVGHSIKEGHCHVGTEVSRSEKFQSKNNKVFLMLTIMINGSINQSPRYVGTWIRHKVAVFIRDPSCCIVSATPSCETIIITN